MYTLSFNRRALIPSYPHDLLFCKLFIKAIISVCVIGSTNIESIFGLHRYSSKCLELEGNLLTKLQPTLQK